MTHDALAQLALDYALGCRGDQMVGAALTSAPSGESELQRVSAEVRERRQRRTFRPTANWRSGTTTR